MAVPKVFISYSHKDEEWKDRVVSHLSVVALDGKLSIWNDRKINAGEDWLPQIKSSLAQCKIALLLISANFLASRFCTSAEVPPLLARREKAGVRVVPVILKPCAWTSVSWLSGIQAHPKNGTPLSGMKASGADAALASLVESLLGHGPVKRGNGMEPKVTTFGDDEEGGGTAVATGTAIIDIKLDRDFDDFSDAEQTAFMDALRRMLSLGDVTVTSKRRGSVVLRLNAGYGDAERIASAAKGRQLSALGVVSAEIIGMAEEWAASETPEYHLRPLEDRVLVRPIASDAKTASGIYLPETAKEKPVRGKIVAVGPGKVLDSGKRAGMSVRSGETVVYGKYAGTEVEIRGVKHLIIRESELLGIIEG